MSDEAVETSTEEREREQTFTVGPITYRVIARFNPKDYGENSRAHKNLNRVAKSFIEEGWVSCDRAVPASVACMAVKMDTSHLRRLISHQPGFVRVVHENTGGAKTLTTYYFDPAFQKAANQQGAPFFPYSTDPLRTERHPAVITARVTSPKALAAKRDPRKLSVPYEGTATSITEASVDVLEMGEGGGRLTEVMTNLPDIFDRMKTSVYAYARAVVQGDEKTITKCRKEVNRWLVIMTSLHIWLSNPLEPEHLLMIHDTIGTEPPPREQDHVRELPKE